MELHQDLLVHQGLQALKALQDHRVRTDDLGLLDHLVLRVTPERKEWMAFLVLLDPLDLEDHLVSLAAVTIVLLLAPVLVMLDSRIQLDDTFVGQTQWILIHCLF